MFKPGWALLPTAAVACFISAACLFGGSDRTPSVTRPGSIPTATMPATLPEPLLVGESQAGSAPSTSAVTGEATYVVKSGDTLGSIATQYGIPPAQQASWVLEVLRLNGIPDATLLQSGVELRLPRITPTPRPTGTIDPTTAPGGVNRSPTTQAAAASATAPPQTSSTPRPTVAAGSGTYTVVAGDFPLLIAQKVGVPEAAAAAWADQLMALNNATSSSLQIGQVLQLPPIPAVATRTP